MYALRHMFVQVLYISEKINVNDASGGHSVPGADCFAVDGRGLNATFTTSNNTS